MLTAVAVAGFARGFGFGLRIAVVADHRRQPAVGPRARPSTQDDLRTSVQWAVEVLLVALVAGYARRISGEADRRQILAMDRLGRLSDANALLYQLHQVTQTLPASLDLDEVLDTTMSQLRELFEFDAVALLVLDDTDLRWHTLRREGTRPPSVITTEDLPPPLARAVRLRSLVSEQNLLAGGGPGHLAELGVGPLRRAAGPRVDHRPAVDRARRRPPLHATATSTCSPASSSPPPWPSTTPAGSAACARSGADEERTRIARDLHDRIGQSLAYLAFELDRIVKNGATGGDNTAALDNLRADVRGVIREVRDTLYDLRTDVTETQSLSTTLEAFLDRVQGAQRPGRPAPGAGDRPAPDPAGARALAHRPGGRHQRRAPRPGQPGHHLAGAATAPRGGSRSPTTASGSRSARPGASTPTACSGMRERAASIGATLVVDSEPGRGTRVRCTLDAH